MNKALHFLVYVFLVLSGAALFFEIQLNAKRAELTQRNRMQENFLVKLATTIEKVEPNKDASFEIKKDAMAVENKLEDSPEMENLLDGYPAPLEQQNLETFNWENSREQLRQVYVLDIEGKPVMDGNEPQTRDSPEEKLLKALLDASGNQRNRLNTTRNELTKMRERLEAVVSELNKLKPEARQDKVTIDERNAKIAKLEEEKAALEDEIKKLKAQIDELNVEITSLKDEVNTAKNETEAAKEELEKANKQIEQLKKLLKEAIAAAGTRSEAGITAVTSLPAGDKGKIVAADNVNMFVIVAFSDAAMTELKGEDRTRPLPALELGVRRPGFQGEAGEFVGRIRLRQEVKGKNYIVCDIIGAWEQDKVKPNDIIFAD